MNSTQHQPIWIPSGPLSLGVFPFGAGAEPDAGLEAWVRGLGGAEPWSAPVTMAIRLTDSDDAQAYRQRFEAHIDFPGWAWDGERRHLEIELPVGLTQHSCWTLNLAHRHGLLAGLCAGALGSDWRNLHGGMAMLPDGRALLVVGHSGAGKSTLLRRLSADLRGDEIVALRLGPHGPELRGTSVPGELRCDDFRPAPLAGVVVPGRSEDGEVRLQMLPSSEQVELLLSAVVRVGPQYLADDLLWLDRLIGRVPMLRVDWNLKGERPGPAVWAAFDG